MQAAAIRLDRALDTLDSAFSGHRLTHTGWAREGSTSRDLRSISSGASVGSRRSRNIQDRAHRGSSTSSRVSTIRQPPISRTARNAEKPTGRPPYALRDSLIFSVGGGA